MRNFAVLLGCSALLAPAFAQTVASPVTNRPKVATVSPAAKPVLLYTGKPITAEEKDKLLTSTFQAYLAGAPEARSHHLNRNQAPPPTLVTVDKMFWDGIVDTLSRSPRLVDIGAGQLLFDEGPSSSLTFNVFAKKDSAYVIGIGLLTVETGRHIVICVGNDLFTCQNPETFQTAAGTDVIHFVYAFIADKTGEVPVAIYSPDTRWQFLSAELTPTPF
jgi:hypothetical protein